MISVRTILCAALVAVAVAMLSLLTPRHATPPVPLPVAAGSPKLRPLTLQIPPFVLSDQNGVPLSREDLRGRVWIVDFIFTHCAASCPKMSDRCAELQKQIPDPRVMFLSFSVDPDRDDVATRKAYAAAHGIDPSRWRFVSPPTRAQALALARAVKIGGPSSMADNPVLHSDRFVLIDTTGRLRGIYPLDDPDALIRLVADAKSSAKE